jgi:hypothetical protein
MKNSNDIIENRTCDLPACSAVPKLTVPPRARTRMWPAHKENKHAFYTEFHAVDVEVLMEVSVKINP